MRQDTARRVAKICNECNLPTDEEEYVAVRVGAVFLLFVSPLSLF